MKYIAHTPDGKTFNNEDECQSLIAHLTKAAEYAADFADDFGARDTGYLLGLLHDLGKYSEEFQLYIRGKKPSASHKVAGAIKLKELYGGDGMRVGMAIAGHHGGLHNVGTKNDVGNNSYLSLLAQSKSEITTSELPIPAHFPAAPFALSKENNRFELSIYIKMLFSALVDADRIDTEEFCTGRKRESIQCNANELWDKLTLYMPENDGRAINQIRSGILADCITAADKPQGLYTLTVPTGGGKTLSSLAFALRHAIKHGLKRIVYVIPYTSIIEQNAAVFKKCMGESVVLEHHSNILIDEENDFRSKWATENWDIPIIVTTNVQFFESFYSNNPSKCRKLHNLAKSVIIFDEAQGLPINYFSACINAICELVQHYSTTAVLCSATQPVISKFKYKHMQVSEIASNPALLAERLKRVEYQYIGSKSNDELKELICEHSSALVILNTRRHAYDIYKLIKQSRADVYHLSTLMTPQHRRATLAKVRELLKDKQPVTLISTSLIEAGVDIDFPVVFRAISGIDSIIQAGGRANREGKLDGIGQVIVFVPSDAVIPQTIRTNVGITKEVIELYGDNAFSLEGIEKYFKLFQSAAVNNDNLLDSKNIMALQNALQYKDVAEKFKLIEQQTYSIVIPTDENAQLIRDVRSGNFSTKILRQLSQYTVGIYDKEYNLLRKDNVIESFDNIHLLNSSSYYNQETGLEIFTSENLNAMAKFT